MAILIDPPTPFDSPEEWRRFLAEMEALAEELTGDAAAIVEEHIKLAKDQLGLPPDPPRFKCPQCKQRTGVNISYGFPSDKTFQQAERGEAVLGGCMQTIGAPDRQCLSCGHQWEIVRRSKA